MKVNAVYHPSFGQYQGNPLIEALPPVREFSEVKNALKSTITINPSEKHESGVVRGHLIAQLMNNFFQPIARHIQLEQKLSIMLREGYVGRNLANGSLNSHLQNGYERMMTGDVNAIRFEAAKSTARSMCFIGCSGSGKTTTLNRILATYPQVIFHEKYNFTQIVYLKIDCPHDGSLKSLCLHFFRAIDQALGSDYERKYALKRHGIETLLNLMRQIANLHAIGLLIIDEIQHLSVNKSGGADKMLNFFVTLVNVVGLPVVMVGTPKARFIFEDDLRSARRGVGLGSILWEQIKNEENFIHPQTKKIIKSEWVGFTEALWKYQWLKKADLMISEEIRDCWYDLSQGIPDIVVKLFVLAQMRAIESGLERITVKLLKQTYEQDLIPIHPMIKALRSGDAEQISQFSDLIIPEVDKKLLLLQAKLEQKKEFMEDIDIYDGHQESIHLHRLLIELGYESNLLAPLIKKVFRENPKFDMKSVMPIILSWLHEQNEEFSSPSSANKPQDTQKIRKQRIQPKLWQSLDNDDLRFQFSQKENKQSFYEHLKNQTDYVINMETLIKEAG